MCTDKELYALSLAFITYENLLHMKIYIYIILVYQTNKYVLVQVRIRDLREYTQLHNYTVLNNARLINKAPFCCRRWNRGLLA